MSSGFTHEKGYQGGTNIWLTPRTIIEKLGPFDLDPCAVSEPRPWPTASRHIVESEDGLRSEWGREEFVWCNPPYGPHTAAWLKKLSAHNGGGIALVFARTETRAFFDEVWPKASAILFVRGRLKFWTPEGNEGQSAAAPSVLIAYGEKASERLANASSLGKFMFISGEKL